MATTSQLQIILNNFENFITTCTPAAVGELNEAIKAVQARHADAAALMASSNMATKVGATRTGISKKQRCKKLKLERATGGPKRPLNSWMAFRKYYNASLAPHTQKTISKVLHTWWGEDPFQAKWAMLAKAYSIVRGSRKKEEVPLDGFFAICAPLIGVISPSDYPRTMGWQLTPAKAEDEDKVPQLTRLFVPSPDMLSEKITTTPLSVDDLVKKCFEAGFARSETVVAGGSTSTGSLTMAVQPTTTYASSATSKNEIGRAVRAVLSDPPAGEAALHLATSAIDSTGSTYPYNEIFDPTSQVDVNFNPNGIEHGEAWDAFDPLMAGNDVTGIDWDAFVVDTSFA